MEWDALTEQMISTQEKLGLLNAREHMQKTIQRCKHYKQQGLTPFQALIQQRKDYLKHLKREQRAEKLKRIERKWQAVRQQREQQNANFNH